MKLIQLTTYIQIMRTSSKGLLSFFSASTFIISICLMAISVINAQGDICPISILGEEGLVSHVRSAGSIDELNDEGIQWTNIEAVQKRDGVYAEISLHPGEQSNTISLSKLNATIPNNAEIHGVQVLIKGDFSGGNIRDLELVWSDSIHNIISTNKANVTVNNPSWSESKWHYGSKYAVWGMDLSQALLNSDDLGIQYSIQNVGDTISDVRIDEIKVVFNYSAIHDICEHECVGFYVNGLDNETSFEWDLPKGFIHLDDSEDVFFASVGRTTDQFGIYEICATATSQGVESDVCCRSFQYSSCESGSLGDYVWFDMNGDGQQQVEENGFEGVPVYLLDNHGFIIGMTTTDANGQYLFEDLERGAYKIKIEIPEGYSAGIYSNGDENEDNDFFNIDEGCSRYIYVSMGEHVSNVDFGLVQLSGLGDYVWFDDNANGLQDDDELGIADVTLTLFAENGDELDNVQTDENGYYLFEGIYPGTYYVTVSGIELDYTITLPNTGDPTLDSNGTLVGGLITSDPFELMSNVIDLSIDFGLVKLSGLGDYVWFDDNLNGLQDANEWGIEGVTMTLTNEDGVALTSVVTDEDGYYFFDDIYPGNYYVKVTDINPNYVITFTNAGDPELDSDATMFGDLIKSYLVELLPNVINRTVDFGFIYNTGKLRGLAWYDVNGNGIQDPGEEGINNIVVDLYSCDGTFIESTTTNSVGEYFFFQIIVNDYFVVFDNVESYEFTISNQEPIDLNSDVTGNNDHVLTGSGTTDCFGLISNEFVLYDAGYTNTVSVGNYVWIDTNADGIQDADESGFNGVSVKLFDEDNVLVEELVTTNDPITNRSGYYLFENIWPGSYYITFDEVANYSFTQTVTIDETNNSDVNESGETGLFEVIATSDRLDIDAGLVPLVGSIVGCLWYDQNNTGAFEIAEEWGESDVVVYLYDVDGNIVDETISYSIPGKEGAYIFENVIPGEYQVKFPILDNYIFVAPNGSSELTDSDVVTENGFTDYFIVNPSETVVGVNAGYITTLGEVNGVVWHDLNGNGLIEFDEPPLEDIRVEVFNSNDELVANNRTDSLGFYSFKTIPQGDVYLKFLVNEQFIFSEAFAGNNTAIDSDVTNSSSGITNEYTIIPFQPVANINAGVYLLGSIGDQVWIDQNFDGIYNDGDTNAKDLVLALLDENGFEVGSTEIIDGYYTFPDLHPGVYTVRLQIPNQFTFTADNTGNNDDIDSDINNITGQTGSTDPITIKSGDERTNIDIGLINQQSFVTGRIWEDLDADGIYTFNETSISNVNLVLFDDTHSIVAITNTDENGNYSFNVNGTGSYYIDIPSQNSVWILTENNVGLDELLDSDFIFADDKVTSGIFEIALGDDDKSIDAGFYRLGDVGDFVWVDTNKNGVQDINESGAENVAIALFDSNNNLIDQTVTDSNGDYQFSALKPGIYSVEITLADTYEFTLAEQLSDSSLDSDITFVTENIGKTDLFFIQSNEIKLDVDAGIYEEEIEVQLGFVEGVVFEDLNANGVFEQENRLSNVLVQIFDLDHTLIDEQQTNEVGAYRFETLPGSYYLTFEFEEPFVPTYFQVGTDTTKDSDIQEINNVLTTNEFDIKQNEVTQNIDAGVFGYGTINGLVWLDTENNQVFDTNMEAGIADVRVYLIDTIGDLLDSTLTNAEGIYSFDMLRPEMYYIGFFINENALFVDANIGPDQALDSDVINDFNGFGLTDGITLASKMIITSINAGVEDEPVMPIDDNTIAGTIFLDEDQDGINTNEDGIEGIQVELYDDVNTLFGTVTTDENGSYQFEDVVDGSYFVSVKVPSDYLTSPENIGMNDNIDSDFINAFGDFKTSIFIIENDDTQYYDAGLFKEVIGGASMGDFVWNDVNLNGIQDENEVGIEGVEVVLFNDMNSVVDTRYSDSSGKYTFNNLAAGTYRINVTLPENYLFSDGLQGSDTSKDSDIIVNVGNAGTSNFITVGQSENNLDIDVALYIDPDAVLEATVQGFVFEDMNADGLFLTDDMGYEGIGVSIYNTSGVLVDNTTTSSDGSYALLIEEEGTFYLTFDLDPSFNTTLPNVGSNDQIDADITQANGSNTTDEFELVFGDAITGVNGGFYQYAEVVGYSWNDENMDGLQQLAESIRPGLEVDIVNNNGQVMSSQISNSEGQLSFENLTPGEYYLKVILDFGYEPTLPNVGANDAIDSDIDHTNGANTTMKFSVASGQFDNTWDIGIIPKPSDIGDTVWEDLDGDGVQTQGEPGLSGILVTLYNSNGIYQEETMTNENGEYKFLDIQTGLYYLVFEVPAGYLTVPSNSGDNDSFDSDVTNAIVDGSTDIFELVPGIEAFDIDCGFYLPSSLGDRVWFDVNGNGLQDSDEIGESDVVVHLMNEDGILMDTKTTDADGSYLFDDLLAGNYYLMFEQEWFLQFVPKDIGDDALDSDVNPSGNTDVINVPYNSINRDIDAGVRHTSAAVGTLVWFDENKNGLLDFNERGLPNVEVQLLDENQIVLFSTFTDIAGEYTFDGLMPGYYYVRVVAPIGYEYSEQDEGINDDVDSDVNENGMSPLIYLDETVNMRNLDAGLFDEGNFLSSTIKTSSVYPNPTIDYITIKIDDAKVDEKVLVRIFDQSGKMMQSIDNLSLDREGALMLDVSNYESGVYNLYFYHNNTRHAYNIVKI